MLWNHWLMHRLPQRLVALILILAAAAACRGPVSETEILRRGNGGDPGSLDPSLAEDVHAFAVLADLYEGLLVQGPDGTILPGVAEAHTRSDDGLVYTFFLREDARWSDGTAVVAADFVRRFRDVATPATASAFGSLLAPIEHFEAVNDGQLAADALGVAAVDDRTLRLALSRPMPQLASILTLPVTFPLHPAAERGVSMSADRVPSNGPYRLSDWQPGKVLRLTRNPHFREAGSVAIERVDYYPIVEPTAELNQYRAGELHVTHTVPPVLTERLRKAHAGELRIAPKLALYYIAFDLTEPPVDRRALREALSLVVDREAIVRLLGRGERPAFGLVPPGVQGYSAERYDWSEVDLAERRRRAVEVLRLAELDPARLPPIRLIYDEGDVHERVALAIAGMWRDTLGVRTELDKREWKRFLATRGRRDEWDAMRFSWFGDYDDPATFTNLFLSGSAQNLPGYESAAYDELLERAAASVDSTERAALIASAERRLLSDYPIVPIYFYVSKHLVSPRVLGFEDNALDRHPSRYLSFEDDS